MLYFKKEEGVDRKEDQANMEPDPNDKVMKDMILDDKI